MKSGKSKKDKIIEAVIEAFLESDDKDEMLKEFFASVDEYKPLVSLGIDWILATIGPELNKILKAMGIGIADQRMDVLEYYKSRGLTHWEAIDMILDSSMRLERAIREHNKKK